MNTVAQHRLAVIARQQRAAEELDAKIVRYRAWLDVNGYACGHPKGAIVRYGVNRNCRVCGHGWGTFAERDDQYVPGDAP
jgi:hypothetical protein